MSTPEIPRRLQDVQSPGAIAMQELRQVRGRVEGDAEQFLTASVIVGAAVHQRAGEADLIALKREAKWSGS
jgi:hypothetical protein